MLAFKPEWEIGPIIIIQIGRAVLCLSSATHFHSLCQLACRFFSLDAPVHLSQFFVGWNRNYGKFARDTEERVSNGAKERRERERENKEEKEKRGK